MSDAPVTLRVVDAAGAPVPRAHVAVVRSAVPFPEVVLVADPGGRVQLTLPEGEFTFRARDGAGRTGEATVRGGVAGEVTLQLG